MSAASAALFDEYAARGGAVISGRRTYEIARGWSGRGPLPGVPLLVLTHEAPAHVPMGELGDPPYTFVADGIESAIEQARAAAGSKDVSLMGSTAVQQALRAGLLDLLALHVVPILLGGGVRLLDDLGELPGGGELELERVVDAPA